MWNKKKAELKGKTDNSTIIIRDLNVQLSIMDTMTSLNINKERLEQHYKPTRPNRRVEHSTQQQNTHFSQVHIEH